MAGSGGFKHRLVKVRHRRQRRRLKARQSIARGRALVESKGQTWDPAANPQQQALLTHEARRVVTRSPYEQF